MASNVDEMIKNHAEMVEEADRLQDKAIDLGKQILEETKDWSIDELLKIYPRIKDSSMKYRLFVKIKELQERRKRETNTKPSIRI